MKTIARPDAAHELDADALAALGRLDDDLRAVEAAVRPGAPGTIDALPDLRRRAVAAYQDALGAAAGQDDDPRWSVLVAAVATFIASVPAGLLGPVPAPAMTRLRRLVSENPR